MATLLAGIACCLNVSRSSALITGRLPLKDVLADNDFIFVGKVQKFYPDKPAMVVTVVEELKGKMPVRTLPVNLAGTGKAKKEVPLLLKRLAADLPLILFVKQRVDEEVFNAFVFTNGTWLNILGQKREDGSASWRFLNGEPFLRRTFKGTTAELRQVIIDGLSGKKQPPEPNEKEPEGYGPEVEQKKGAATPSERAAEFIAAAVRRDKPGGSTGHVLFGVIPTLGVGGPLAILAVLFPSVFGGVLLLFRRWLALFTVVSVISLVYLFHYLFHNELRGSWWGSDDALWYLMMLVTFLGALWAWTRYITWASDPALPSPGRAELLVLWIMGLSCAGIIGTYAAFSEFPSRLEVVWGLFLTFTFGIWLATVYKTYRAILGGRRLAPEVSVEGLILWAALIGFTGFAAERGGLGTADPGGTVLPVSSANREGVSHPAEFVREVWRFHAPERGGFVSSAALHGDHVFIAAAHPLIKKGTLYCLNRRTGEKVSQFIDAGEFIEPYSSPFIADGHLYIGEGFHTDPDCKLYCLDIRALTDQDRAKRKFRVVNKLETTSQTESSPVVANGRVFFGAGNDGFCCVDAVTLQLRWRFPKDPSKGRLRRFCGTAAVAGKRVYVGTGIDRGQKEDKGETAIFCLDADSGELVWKVPTDLPVWAAPVVFLDRVYCGIGNGDIVTDAEDDRPAGAMLCLDANTGRQICRVDVSNGIIDRAAADRHHVYFGCRDGHVYCLSRFTGKERWKTPMGSPVVTAPALAKCSDCDATAAVYALATAGRVCCLDPATGKVQWTFSLEARAAHLASSPRVEVIPTSEGDRRRIYFGAALGAGPTLTGQAVVYCLEDRVIER